MTIVRRSSRSFQLDGSNMWASLSAGPAMRRDSADRRVGRRKGMAHGGERICDLAEQAASAEDAMSALSTLTELRHEADELVRGHVKDALEAGHSIPEVARALEISRQAAHRRYR